jgi:uncharacterized OB-fold protein
MTDSGTTETDDGTEPRLLAYGCPNGHFTSPGHPRCPTCGDSQQSTVDHTTKTGTVVTWTRVASTPPGVREPNTLALVEFELESGSVRVLGSTAGAVSAGDEVQPIHVERLRDPERTVRAGTDQPWDGFRFEPV